MVEVVEKNSLRDTPPTSDVIQNSGDMAVESLLDWPVFRSHGRGSRPRLNSILGQRSAELSECSLVDDVQSIDPTTMSNLVSNFLSTNHIKNPILDIEQLWADAEDLAKTGVRWDGKSCLVVGSNIITGDPHFCCNPACGLAC